MKKLMYLIVLALILALVLTGCSLLSNISQVPATDQSGITYLTKAIDLDPGLVGLWHFDEVVGTTTSDSSGNSNEGTLKTKVGSVPSLVSGYFGNALSFSSTSKNYVEVTNNTELNPANVTVEAWVNLSSFNSRPHIVGKGLSSKGAYYLVVETTGKVRLFYTLSTGNWHYVESSSILNTGTWYHLAGTYNGADAKVYIDCNEEGTIDYTGSLAMTDSNNVFIGCGPNATYGFSDGIIDEVRIWSSALVASQLDDMTAPTIAITTPANGATYLLNEEVYADWSVSDGTGTGVATESAVPSELKIDTSTVGSHTFTVTATDYAINEASQAVTYYVHEPFGGFLPPVETGRAFKLGSTIPVKFQLRDAEDNFITDAVAMISLQKLVSGLPEGEVFEDSSGAANTGNLFRYDPTSNQYIFNLSTKGATFGTWRITITLDYGATYFVDIGLK